MYVSSWWDRTQSDGGAVCDEHVVKRFSKLGREAPAMADPNIKPSSNKMVDVNTCTRGQRANASGRSSSREPNVDAPGVGDLVRKDIRNKWSFDYINNRGCPDLDSKSETIAQAQFAYYHWTEKLKEFQQLEDRKKNDRRDYQTEIYQIIGFYSVFQGVIFQGVTSMASQLDCGFYKIPVILSVISSAATFLGIYVKFKNIEDLNGSINEDKVQTKGFHDRIRRIEKYSNVKEFDIDQIEFEINSISKHQGIYVGEQHSTILKWGVLGFLVAFSSIFAYLDFVVMCRGYR